LSDKALERTQAPFKQAIRDVYEMSTSRNWEKRI